MHYIVTSAEPHHFPRQQPAGGRLHISGILQLPQQCTQLTNLLEPKLQGLHCLSSRSKCRLKTSSRNKRLVVWRRRTGVRPSRHAQSLNTLQLCNCFDLDHISVALYFGIRQSPPESLLGSNKHSIYAEHPEECDIIAPFIFDSLHFLLKQWLNTYAPNGHTIIPVTLLPNPPLYHANGYPGKPKKPTWYAFDA